MMDLAALALVVCGTSFAATGAALLLRRVARASAALLLTAGLGAVVAAVLVGSGRHAAGERVAVLAVGLALVLSLAAYPALRWRHPVDLVALAALTGCGVTAVLWPATTEVQGLIQFTVLFAYIWWRIETAHGRERRAVQWLAMALGATSLTVGLLVFAAEGWADSGVFALLFVLVGPAMYVGATLPDLVDVRGLVVTAVVLGVSVLAYMGVFVLGVGLLGVVGAEDPSLGSVALVGAVAATTFHPLQVLLRSVVDEMLFGLRPDPLGAASAVAVAVGDRPLPALRAIREALALPYAALRVEGEVLAASGHEPTHTRTLSLDGLGELVVGLRPGDLRFSAGDEHVLALVVPLLAQTLRARAMTEQLRESRSATIAAVEDERRRLRRELHDGLGPRLSGVAFASDAVKNVVRSDPAAAEEMLVELRADTVAAIEEIRRLVYAMRPPALDELGLVPALRQQARGLRNRDGEPISVGFDAPDTFSDLPAAVEVAAYRIVVEALANVARHSSSRAASVRMAVRDGALDLTVTDGGAGSGTWHAGVGLSSMRERAAELGGSLRAGPGPAGGAVRASLPLRG